MLSRAIPAVAPALRWTTAAFRASTTVADPAGLSHDRVMEMFDAIDVNGDGVIDRGEFIELINQYENHELNNLAFAVDRLKESDSRNELSATYVKAPDAEDGVVEPKAGMVSRTLVTAEVAISKIFMAGFGWQGFSAIAEAQNFAPDSLLFALTTGLGDCLGVAVGHAIWMTGRKAVDPSIDLVAQYQTGLLLGSAAFCSGSVWQPIVNLTSSLGFNTCLAMVGAGCGIAFLSGLRAGRAMYSDFMYGIEEPTYGNLKADMALSLSVGAACAAFVGTDLSFEAQNWLADVVGIGDVSTVTGMAIAGCSTALGFTVIQTLQNIVVPAGKNWVD